MILKSYLVEKDINLLNQNIVLLYGENFGLKDDFKKKIIESNKDAEVINLDQNDILKNDNSFFSEILNISLFNEKKIFFIYQTNDKILDVILKIEKKLSAQKIYLFSEILDKRSKLRNYFEISKSQGVIACYADDELAIRKIISEKLKDFNGLSKQIINIIIESCGLDRIKLKNELNKIISFFIDKKINVKHLQQLLNISVNEDFDLLKDHALMGNISKTNKLLSDTILEKDKNIMYLNMIHSRLSKLQEFIKISKNSKLEEAIKELRPPIFWRDKPIFLLQAKKWSVSKIKKILIEIYSIENKIKSNFMIVPNSLVKKLMLDICNTANS
jgi:DNA polymerase-3 subunit delta